MQANQCKLVTAAKLWQGAVALCNAFAFGMQSVAWSDGQQRQS